MNTYDQMLELVDRKLATVSVNGNLSTFKYARKVMFENLWDKYPELYECRGHTYDNTTGELVVAAPRKSFNYGENGCGLNLKDSDIVWVHKKYNGFLACVSMHNGEVVVSTTGSTKSDFVAMAKEVLKQNQQPTDNRTDFYEIIHDDDPHIVDEGQQKAVLLGSRYKDNGMVVWQDGSLMTFGEAKGLAKNDRGEGFMVYSQDDMLNAIKLKSPYYVGKKKLMRANKKNVEAMYRNPIDYAEKNLPAMWISIPLNIVSLYSLEDWIEMNDQQRRFELEKFEGLLR